MTTLKEIINSVDELIIREEQLNDKNSLPNPILGEIEEMRKYVLVTVGKERLAIPIDGLAEIGPMPSITSLPNLPDWILGIANQRGEIISVIDLPHLMNNNGKSASKGQRLAVLQKDSMKVGISLDQIIATVSRPESDRVNLEDSFFSQIEPDVFGKGLQVDQTIYEILNPTSFMDMDRLMHFYLAE